MQDAVLAPGSAPARFWINMDKGLTGLMILGLGGLPLMRTWVEWKTTLRKIWTPVLLGVAVFAAVGTGTGFVRFDPQLKPLWLLWLATHLFFVAICEEVFWRGFVQKTLETVWQNQTWGRFLALGLTSLVFGLTHTGHPLFQALACGAGLFYGALFQKTGRLESAVIPHFLLRACRHEILR
jgi:membrane protease YdiL (CAAX protease family)